MLDEEVQALRRQQLKLSNEKLEEEIKKAKMDVKPQSLWAKITKAILPIGGVVTIFVSAWGIYDSYTKNLIDREHTRLSETKARIDDAVKQISSKESASRVLAIGVLSGYLDGSNQEFHRQILYTLAVAMAKEYDPQVQAAIRNLIEGIESKNADGVVSNEVAKGRFEVYLNKLTRQSADTMSYGAISSYNWKYFLDTMVSQNRSLVEKANLETIRKAGLGSSPIDGDEFAAQKLGDMISLVVRKNVVEGYLDFSGIYCVGCDFHDISFPNKVDFSNAILDGTNFNRVTLRDSVFNNSSLLGAKFVEADLTGSDFGSNGDQGRPNANSLKYVLTALVNEAEINLELPDFSCSNLSNANFKGRAIFPAVVSVKRVYDGSSESKNHPWYKTVPERWKSPSNVPNEAIDLKPIKFYMANMTGAKLQDTLYFSMYKTKEPLGDLIDPKTRVAENDEVTAYQGHSVADIAFSKIADPLDVNNAVNSFLILVKTFQSNLRASMYGAKNVEKSLPEGVSRFLDSSEPTEADFHGAYMSHRPPEEIDPDANCRPR